MMEKFTTKSGATLERRILQTNQDGSSRYEFTLRVAEPFGEAITLLGVYNLTNPEYFTNKFLEEE